MLADVLKHILAILAGCIQENHIVALKLLVKPVHHVMHHLTGGRVDLIDIRIVKIVLVLGREAVHHRNSVGLAECVNSSQLLRLTGSDYHIHGLELGQGENAVGDI